MSVSLSQEDLSDDPAPAREHMLGFEKRTIRPAVIVIALVAVFVGLLPAIDQSIAYDREIAAGDIIDLGSGFTFVPAEGWGLASGMLVTDHTPSDPGSGSHLDAILTSEGVSLRVITGPFSGTPEELLDQVRKLNQAFGVIEGYTVVTDMEPVTTDDGFEGMAQAFTGVNVEGIITTFVIDGVGIEFIISGPPGSLAANDDTVPDMISSLQQGEPGAEE